jgi:peptidoglycan biosynthesis protein MviN/MurJ (putative lipid II flippase)
MSVMVGMLLQWMQLSRRPGRVSRRGGQAMIEYVIVTVALVAVVLALAVLMYVLRQQSNRVLDLVASDYP